MKSGETVFEEINREENGWYRRIVKQHCLANPRLAELANQLIAEEKDPRIALRLIQAISVFLEIIGAGNKSDKNYILVSQESVESAKKAESGFDDYIIYNEDPPFFEAVNEAKACVRQLNRVYNENYKVKIDLAVIFGTLNVLLNACWIERQKQKHK